MGRLFKESDPQKFIKYSEESLNMNVYAGRSSAAANIAKEVATTLDEAQEKRDAAIWYEKAASIYANDNNMSTAN